MTTVATNAPTPRRTRGERLREFAPTTPGQLSLWACLAIVAIVVAGLGACLTGLEAGSGAGHLRTGSEPLLSASAQVYTDLADADATAARSFLAGGLEPPAQTQRYETDLQRANEGLATAAALAAGSQQATTLVARLTAGVTHYSELVSAARSNNRQGYPIGSAYLAESSLLSHQSLLPDARALFELQRQELGYDYRSARAERLALASMLALVLALALLAGLQRTYYLRTKRVLSPSLATATALTLTLLILTGVGSLLASSALSRADREGSAPLSTLQTLRITELNLRSDEALTLVARGDGAANEGEWKELAPAVTPLLDQLARELPSSDQGSVQTLRTAFAAVQSQHAVIRILDDQKGDYLRAVQVELDPSSSAISAQYDSFDTVLAKLSQKAQNSFSSALGSGSGLFASLSYLAPLLSLVALLLVVVGLRPRLEEYR